MSRVYRDAMSYVYVITIFKAEHFSTKQKMDIKDGVTKLAFRYELSGNTAANYNVYALILHERKAELEQKDGKLLLRA